MRQPYAMLVRNSLWNVAGSALPALAALAAVPLMLGALGAEGFGLVTLVGSVIGYFALFDLNLSAGAIKYLSESHAAGEARRFAETFWFGILFYCALGLFGMLLLFVGAGWIAVGLLGLHGAAADTAAAAIELAAFGFALAQLQGYLLVVPQALQRYDLSARSEAVFGVLVNAASAGAALAGWGVAGVIAARVAVAACNVLVLVWLVRRLDLALAPAWPGAELRRRLTRFSAYAYLSKLASALQQHGDKLVIGALAGPVALTFYSVPAQLASRILGLTYRLSSVIYPAASALAAARRLHELRPLYLAATRCVTYVNLAALGLVVLAGDEFLRRWVGAAFVANGYPVLVLMMLALLCDSLTNIPSLVNDALGHPQVSGRFALARAAFGIGFVYLGTLSHGIVGAAYGHLAVALASCLAFLAYVHGRTVPVGVRELLREGLGRSLLVGALVLGLLLPLKGLLPPGPGGALALVGGGTLALLLAGVAFIASVDERAALLAAARRLRGAG